MKYGIFCLGIVECSAYSLLFDFSVLNNCHMNFNSNPYVSVRLAKLAVDKVLTAPCSTSVLYPRSGGNLHCFTAITPCAVLDILAPPYDEFAGRRCSYYRDYPCSSLSK